MMYEFSLDEIVVGPIGGARSALLQHRPFVIIGRRALMESVHWLTVVTGTLCDKPYIIALTLLPVT